MVIPDTMVGAFDKPNAEETEEQRKERIQQAKPVEPKVILALAKASLADAKAVLQQFLEQDEDL